MVSQPAVGSRQQSDGPELARSLAKRVAQKRKAVAGLLRACKSLERPWSDPKGVERAMEAIGTGADALPPALKKEASALREVAAAWLRSERDGRRRRLAETIRGKCKKQGIRLLVLTKEPLEIRLPPLSVRIDLEKVRAAVLFGRVEIGSAVAAATEILKARDKALKALERRKWSPRTFHRELRTAWGAAGRRLGRADGWIELAEVLPELAFRVQGPGWRFDPTPKNLTPYGKAQFLYDLHRLRAAGALAHDGWRLALGPATGASTRDKRKVFWVEDGEGRGSYHLTLRFTREAGVHGEEA